MRKKYRKNMIAFPLIFIIIGLLILRHLFTNQGDIHIALDTTYFNLRKLVNIFTDSQHLAWNANTHY